MESDLFISYASEDRKLASALAGELRRRGIAIWYDEFAILPGQSIRRSIEAGLASCEAGVVVLSRSFFQKPWTNDELDGLFSGGKPIIPLWRDVGFEDVNAFSPILAGRKAIFATQPLHDIVEKILAALFAARGWTPYEFTWADGTTMVLLPAQVESPIAVCLGKHPVTNEQYRAFVRATGCAPPEGQHYVGTPGSGSWAGPFHPWEDPEFSEPDQPVVCVSRADAARYCRWINEQSGQKNHFAALPTPELWNLAAFGKEHPPTSISLTLAGQEHAHSEATSPSRITNDPARVNSRGVADLIGNVWEWCEEADPWRHRGNPAPGEPAVWTGAVFGAVSVFAPTILRRTATICGGSYLDPVPRSLPSVPAGKLPEQANTRHSDIGFRLAAVVKRDDLPPNVGTRLGLQRFSSARIIPDLPV